MQSKFWSKCRQNNNNNNLNTNLTKGEDPTGLMNTTQIHLSNPNEAKKCLKAIFTILADQIRWNLQKEKKKDYEL